MCEHVVMVLSLISARVARMRICAIAFGLLVMAPPCAASCAPPELGQGHVAEIIDGRSFRLTDGREIRLAGIEPAGASKTDRISALAAVLADRDVLLRGMDDAPDRYGRQTAFAYLAGSDIPVQVRLLAAGSALVSPDLDDSDCAAALKAAESEARQAQKGTWAVGTRTVNAVIKNAESPDDILSGIGRFTVVERQGLVRPPVRRDDLPQLRTKLDTRLCCDYFKARLGGLHAGRVGAQIARKQANSRAGVEARQGQGQNQGQMQGPRIDVARVGQIEVLGGN